MAPSPLDKQTAGCNSPHDWLISLAMDVVICGTENGTYGCHLAVFSVDINFPCYYVSIPVLLLPPYRNAIGIGYVSNNYLKWCAIQLAIQSIVGE